MKRGEAIRRLVEWSSNLNNTCKPIEEQWDSCLGFMERDLGIKVQKEESDEKFDPAKWIHENVFQEDVTPPETIRLRDSIAGLTEELHYRLHVQARNLLLEYRLGNGTVPHGEAEKLMRLYGNLIAKLILSDQTEAWEQAIEDIDWATDWAKTSIEERPWQTDEMNKLKEIRKKYGLKD